MVGKGRNSELTVNFLTSFSRLQRYMDGSDPSTLGLACSQDDSIADAAQQLGWAALSLEVADGDIKAKVVKPVDPEFIIKFRDYEENWKESVAIEMWRGLGLDDLIDGTLPLPRHANSNLTSAKHHWKFENGEAATITSKFEMAIGRAVLEVQEDDSLPDDFRVSMFEAGDAWNKLSKDYEIDIQGKLRRRRLLPQTFVSQHVSDHARAEMLENYNEAQRAFVGGAHSAAYTLLRSVLEMCLNSFLPNATQHETLGGKVYATENRVNRTAKVGLHSIVSRANDILHGPRSALVLAVKPKRSVETEEMDMVRDFRFVRALIESFSVQKRR
jgi:hypothetical protein